MGGSLSRCLYAPGLCAVVLVIATALLYRPTLNYPFVYEDRNDPGASFFPWWTAFDARSEVAAIARRPPRAVLSWVNRFNVWLDGVNPDGWHAVNVILHLVNGLLLFSLAQRLLSTWPALLALGVFWLHPIQTEAVAYVSGRGELILTAGVLLACIGAVRRRWWLAALGCVLAISGKETGVMAVPLVLFLAWWTKAPVNWLLVTVASLFVGILAFAVGLEWRPPTVEYMTTQLTLCWTWLRLIVLPYGQTIDHDPQWAQGVWLAAGVTGWALAGLAAWVTGRSFLTLALGSMALLLLPRIVVTLAEGVHEHHLYPVLVGWSLCAAAWVSGEERITV